MDCTYSLLKESPLNFVESRCFNFLNGIWTMRLASSPLASTELLDIKEFLLLTSNWHISSEKSQLLVFTALQYTYNWLFSRGLYFFLLDQFLFSLMGVLWATCCECGADIWKGRIINRVIWIPAVELWQPNCSTVRREGCPCPVPYSLEQPVLSAPASSIPLDPPAPPPTTSQLTPYPITATWGNAKNPWVHCFIFFIIV